MSQFCTNCGCQLDNNTMFCVNCGARISNDDPTTRMTEFQTTSQSASQSASQTKVATKPKREKKPAAGKKGGLKGFTADLKTNRKKLAILISAAVVVVAAVVILLICLLSNPFKPGLDNMLNLGLGKQDAVMKVIPKELYSALEEHASLDQSDFKNNADDYAEEIGEKYIDFLGEGAKFKYDVVQAEKMPKKMVKKIADGLENNYFLDSSKVKDGYLVKIEGKLYSEEGLVLLDEEFSIVKIGNSWYVVEWNGGEGKRSCTDLLGLEAIMSTEAFDEAAKIDRKSTFGLYEERVLYNF